MKENEKKLIFSSNLKWPNIHLAKNENEIFIYACDHLVESYQTIFEVLIGNSFFKLKFQVIVFAQEKNRNSILALAQINSQHYYYV